MNAAQPDFRKHAETMLYKSPGPHTWEGMAHDFIVVPDAEVEAKLAEGWCRTVPEAVEAAKASAEQQLAANEAEQAQIAKKLDAAGESTDSKPVKGKAKG